MSERTDKLLRELDKLLRSPEGRAYRDNLLQDLEVTMNALHTKGEFTISEENQARTRELYTKVKENKTK